MSSNQVIKILRRRGYLALGESKQKTNLYELFSSSIRIWPRGGKFPVIDIDTCGELVRLLQWHDTDLNIARMTGHNTTINNFWRFLPANSAKRMFPSHNGAPNASFSIDKWLK